MRSKTFTVTLDCVSTEEVLGNSLQIWASACHNLYNVAASALMQLDDMKGSPNSCRTTSANYYHYYNSSQHNAIGATREVHTIQHLRQM